MATIVIETGEVVAGANSFVSESEYVEYFEEIGVSTNGDNLNRLPEQLVAAFRVMNRLYSGRLQGLKVSGEQTGLFPRQGMIDLETGLAIDSGTIPQAVKYWQVEATYILLTQGSEVLEPVLPQVGGVKSFSSKVDVIEESVTFADVGYPAVSVFTKLDSLIRPFLKTFLSTDMPIVVKR